MLSPTKMNETGSHGDLYDNPFASSSANSFHSEAALIEPDVDLTGQSTVKATEAIELPPLPPTGSIGTSNNRNINSNNSQSNQQEGTSTYTGEDTLDEPVTVTIMRDLKKVGNKLLQVLHPKGDRNVLKDWDLWGPLLLCLTLAIVLSIKAPDKQAVPIFTGVFVIIWVGAAVVTLNAKMLGGAVSFFQSVCVIGYCLFPIVVSAIIAAFVSIIWVRIPIAIITFAWSTYASVGFMSESQVNLESRRALAVS
ncbi:unnamed protein product [Mucor hiemalis]